MNIIASNRPFPNRTFNHEVDLGSLVDYKPKDTTILFPFWSWKVPKEITDRYTCIGFHTGSTNGGSPIQNLIRQGVEHTHIRVFKMNNEIDGGEVIDKLSICLNGSLEEIIIRMTEKMHGYIQKNYS